ncbi:MAG: caspase family protein [Gemmatimonadaceae bacterium]
MTRRRALLIGNGEFPDSGGALLPLRGPASDVLRLSTILKDDALGKFEVDDLLVNASSADIRKAVGHLLADASPTDMLLIYYSGHGKLSFRGQLCLCARDTKINALAATSLTLPQMRELIGESPCEQVTLMLDCCFSGAAAEAFATTRSALSDQLQIARAPGLHILSSSDAAEVSQEHTAESETLGAFTRCLIDGITSGEADLNDDGEITVAELSQYAQSKLRGQRPQYTGMKTAGSPIVAWSRERQRRRDEEQERSAAERRRKRLAKWYNQGDIPAGLYKNALYLMEHGPESETDKKFHRLFDDFLGLERMSPAVFVRAWKDLQEATDVGAGAPAGGPGVEPSWRRWSWPKRKDDVMKANGGTNDPKPPMPPMPPMPPTVRDVVPPSITHLQRFWRMTKTVSRRGLIVLGAFALFGMLMNVILPDEGPSDSDTLIGVVQASTGRVPIANPGFEDGSVGWSASAGVITSDRKNPARTGQWKAWLGGHASNHTDSLWQDVALPPTTGSISLNFYLFISSDESRSAAVDGLLVLVADTQGKPLESLASFSNMDVTTGFEQRTVDLSSYAGRTIRIKLISRERGSKTTTFLVDDFEIVAAGT